jgi:OFA family oxalate/formate antiporter-like MFS transporter
MQIALGAVYAWSVFRKPLSEEYGASVAAVNATFSITILALGFAAFLGGLWMERVGPRRVALTAGILYGAGMILASFADTGLWALYLTYGLIGGIGIGLGYIVPIATLVKWFPDRRGFITGIAVAGFGAGALVTAPVARLLVRDVGLFETFAVLGVIYLVMVTGAALLLRNPPEGWQPEGWTAPSSSEAKGTSGRDFSLREALSTWQWYALWAILFLNVTAGIAIISEAAPMAEEITGASAAVAAGVVSIFSIGNAVGRFAWAWLSDLIGRKWVFLTMYVLEAALLVVLAQINTYAMFAALGCILISMYGGGFGTMPAFAADYFGARNVGKIYGLMLTAWGFGGVLGPLLISTVVDQTGQYTTALYILAGMLLAGSVLPLALRPPAQAADGGDAPRTGRFDRSGVDVDAPAAREAGERQVAVVGEPDGEARRRADAD